MTVRTICEVVSGNTQYDGAGVKLVRVIGHSNTQEFDPFLMLDAFDSTDPNDYIKGFPWHPHRGIETVTYLINGNIEHGDSIGNKGKISDGCCQWMTAGSGIMHQEMPQPSDRMWGVQLWLNLPQKDKMTTPQYRDITADMVPIIYEENCMIRVISGNYKNIMGAAQGDYVKTQFLDIEMKAETEFTLHTETDATLFVYILDGEGWFGDANERLITNKKAVRFNNGDVFRAKASQNGLRFLLFLGKPLKEPIAWGGPIVMNTQEELKLAFREIENKTFVKKD